MDRNILTETTHRVVEIPIVETEMRPRVVLFESESPEEVEGFYFDYIERDDVDEFYVVFGTIEETEGVWGTRTLDNRP